MLLRDTGTDLAYDATRYRYWPSVCCYAIPVLTSRMLLRDTGTDLAYAATRHVRVPSRTPLRSTKN
eukprot:996149-Rhodomonas_salina.2